METIKGKLEAAKQEEGIGRNGKPYTRYVYTIDGKSYSTFDIGLWDQKFPIGAYVSIEGEQQGKFFNMKTMEVIDKPKEDTKIVEMAKENNPDQSIIQTDLLRKILAELKSN
jgi:hypothetical protein